ncbi:hypothetical protein [Novosphingobium sp. Gsoil 351]|uniref:hypothetical protein n=1 Tax=Novosphingobium sp. Gsoil 351 TaxID=2675225 RepID=UPI0012B4F95E|nr:hypothetical protein [Novosphingobium sp. Gsoil 351]QGN55409.1 hypothetical protein GKE62_13495 [Novosphingobium sp. Gsoil 351]
MDMAYDQVLIAAAALLGLVVIAASTLKGWQGWLELKRCELDRVQPAEPRPGTGAARIELADLRERVRKLEAIAAGVDL